VVAEKIEFEKKNLAPPSGQTGNDTGHVTICSGISESMKTLGLELTTLFEFFNIAFGPTNGMSRKILL